MATIKYSRVSAVKCVRLLIAFGFKCFNCEKAIDMVGFHVDHLNPRLGSKSAKDGAHEFANLCPLCKNCNSLKGKQPAHEFYTKKQYAKLVKLTAKPALIPKEEVFKVGNAIARKLHDMKFARKWRSGIYYTGENG